MRRTDAALFGLPGRTAMVGSLTPTPSKEPAPRIVRQQRFAHRLLRPVGRERRVDEIVGNRFRERRAEHGN